MPRPTTEDFRSIATVASSDRIEAIDGVVDAAPYLDHWARTHLLPTLIVTHDLVIVWANDAARQLLDEREDLQQVGENLSLGDVKGTEAFRAFLGMIATVPAAFVHRRRMAESYFIIRAQLLAVSEAAPVIVLTLQSSTALDRYVWADFGPVFALTRSEVIVIKQLVEGSNAEQIAMALCVSVETVRTHIKRSYAKVGVSSREKLFSTIIPYRLG